MVKKKSNKKNIKKKEIDEIVKEFTEVEQWVVERKKFLIKLAWVIGFTTILLIISNFFLKVRGFG